jgi:hypothetical protein
MQYNMVANYAIANFLSLKMPPKTNKTRTIRGGGLNDRNAKKKLYKPHSFLNKNK